MFRGKKYIVVKVMILLPTVETANQLEFFCFAIFLQPVIRVYSNVN